MNLISNLFGKHLLSVNLQPDESYFCEAMEPEAMDRLDEVLKGFQPGDAERIRTVLLVLKDPMWTSCAEVLERMRELCLKMEES